MTNRRHFLQLSAAAAGSIPLSGPVLGATIDSFRQLPTYPFYKVIYDNRYQECQAFADDAAAHGATLYDHGGDVTDLWYDDLYHQWNQGPAAIAGLTLESHAFVLEVLARDAGLRQVFRGEHIARDGKPVEHRLHASSPVIARADDIVSSASCLGRAASRLIAEAGNCANETATEYSNVESASVGEPVTLVSWILAPAFPG